MKAAKAPLQKCESFRCPNRDRCQTAKMAAIPGLGADYSNTVMWQERQAKGCECKYFKEIKK